MNAYAEAKSALISKTTARAERWAAESSWTCESIRVPGMTVARLMSARTSGSIQNSPATMLGVARQQR